MAGQRGAASLLGLGLFFLAVLPYGPVTSNGFVDFDDGAYIVDNPQVRDGLTGAGLRWSLTTFQEGNYHPVTWWSHMLDCQLFGLRAGAHHAVSVAIHGVNTVLLFALLLAMTGELWPSAVVAALFAVHPLRVESVAWAAE